MGSVLNWVDLTYIEGRRGETAQIRHSKINILSGRVPRLQKGTIRAFQRKVITQNVIMISSPIGWFQGRKKKFSRFGCWQIRPWR